MAAGAILFAAGNATAQNHDFSGSYLVDSFYLTVDFSYDYMGDYPLEIDNNNVVTQFADFDLTELAGLEIKGNVEGNTFTFQSAMGLLVVAEEAGGHFTVLTGYDGDDENNHTLPVELTYNPDSNIYSLSDWALWDYNSYENTWEIIGYCYVTSVTLSGEDGEGDGDGEEDLDCYGQFIVSGTKVVYSNGVAGEETPATFTMKIQDDGDLGYEFPLFAGYEVQPTERGWLGVYGYLYDNNRIEIQGDNIDSNPEDGLMVGTPDAEFNELYIITVTFTNNNEGKVSDFGVWKTVNGEATELIEVWSNLTFTREGSEPGSGDGPGAVNTIGSESNQAPVYFDLNGRKVLNPSNGVYIIKQGNETRKVMIRK